MLVKGSFYKTYFTRIWLSLFALAALLALYLLSPLALAPASATSSPMVTYWPSGSPSGVPNVVGIVNESDTNLIAGSLTINNGASLSGCTVNRTDYVCNTAGIQWNRSYVVSGWVTDDHGGTANVSWSFQPTQMNKPNLGIKKTKAYWSSFNDYQNGKLSVDSTLQNSGPDTAYNVIITKSDASSGVTLGTAMPLAVGNINNGASAVATLHYNVPTGTASFQQRMVATASDSLGNTYDYQPAITAGAGKNIGISVGDNLADLSDQALDSAMSDMASIGVGWVRFDMAWSAAQPNGPGSFNWPRFDRIVAAASRHGLQVDPLLTYTPAWARPAGCTSFKCGPADPAQFAAYAAAAAAHYAPMGVHTWEIWNEPNITQFWQPAPNPAAYTTLLKQSYSSIKQVDPLATVISAGLSDPSAGTGNIDPRDFLTQMYQNGAKNYMDAVGYHPYSFPNIPSGPSWTGWGIMGETMPSIRSIMVAYGDSNKQVWATEFGSPTNGPTWRGDELVQAVMVRDGIQQITNQPWIAGLFFHTYQDLGTDTSTIENFFGLVRFDGSHKPAYYSLKDVIAGR